MLLSKTALEPLTSQYMLLRVERIGVLGALPIQSRCAPGPAKCARRYGRPRQ
jgi:hypothetical protein